MSFARMLKRRKGQDTPVPQGVKTITINPIDLLCSNAASFFARQKNIFAFLYPDDPAEYLLPGSGERFELRLHDIDAAAALRSRVEGALTGQALGERYDDFPHAEAILFDRTLGQVVMSTTIFEQRTNAEFIVRAHGRVLILGLGLGMVLLAAQRKPEVSEITVVELHEEIIQFVGSRLPLGPKVRLIQGDAFEWTPDEGQRFDTIWADVWNTCLADAYPQMAALRERYTPYLAPGGWLGVWQEGAALVDYYRHGSLR